MKQQQRSLSNAINHVLTVDPAHSAAALLSLVHHSSRRGQIDYNDGPSIFHSPCGRLAGRCKSVSSEHKCITDIHTHKLIACKWRGLHAHTLHLEQQHTRRCIHPSSIPVWIPTLRRRRPPPHFNRAHLPAKIRFLLVSESRGIHLRELKMEFYLIVVNTGYLNILWIINYDKR